LDNGIKAPVALRYEDICTKFTLYLLRCGVFLM